MSNQNFSEEFEGISPEREIPKISKYQFSVKLILTPQLRKFNEVNLYYSNPSVSPLTYVGETSDVDEENEETFNNVFSNNNDDTGPTLIQTDSNIRSKSVEERAPISESLYYKSTQQIKIPKASIFKRQYLQEKRIQNLRINFEKQKIQQKFDQNS